MRADQVTESKLLPLAAWQANQSRDEFLGQRNRGFIWKASRQRRWWSSVPRNHLILVRIETSFILEEEGV